MSVMPADWLITLATSEAVNEASVAITPSVSDSSRRPKAYLRRSKPSVRASA